MKVVVLPDTDERVCDLEPGWIGYDENHIYVPESAWPAIKDALTSAATEH